MKKNKNNRNKKLVKNVILGSCLLGRFTGGAVSLQASAPGPIWPQGASGIVSLYDGLLYTLIMQRARRMRGVDQGAFIVEARRLIGRGANLDRVRALLGRADEDPITRENMQGLLGEIDAAIPRVAP
ncbi:MAG: hypothetical protein LBG09_03255, partial [Puniceicoccales bacterium]|nr:hypothetical protein [Puniceicoccales bacterium]